MIIHDFSLPAKQLRIDTYYFCLMLVLVILQIETALVFLNMRLHIFPDVTRTICKKIEFLKVSRNPETFRASALVETGPGQKNGSCITTYVRNDIP